MDVFCSKVPAVLAHVTAVVLGEAVLILYQLLAVADFAA